MAADAERNRAQDREKAGSAAEVEIPGLDLRRRSCMPPATSPIIGPLDDVVKQPQREERRRYGEYNDSGKLMAQAAVSVLPIM